MVRRQSQEYLGLRVAVCHISRFETWDRPIPHDITPAVVRLPVLPDHLGHLGLVLHRRGLALAERVCLERGAWADRRSA